jgi:hypothetical protein
MIILVACALVGRRQDDVVVVDNNAGKVALNTTLKVISPALSVGTMAAKIPRTSG